jgi:hypothetical protein
MHLDPTALAPISTLSINHSEISTPTVDRISMEIVDSSLTAYNSTQSPLDPPESFAPQLECSRETINVLIVDDNDINLKVRMHLSKLLCNKNPPHAAL